jgi:hypothetical protein
MHFAIRLNDCFDRFHLGSNYNLPGGFLQRAFSRAWFKNRTGGRREFCVLSVPVVQRTWEKITYKKTKKQIGRNGKTSNAEHRTSNTESIVMLPRHSMFGVQRSMFDVLSFPFTGRFSKCPPARRGRAAAGR